MDPLVYMIIPPCVGLLVVLVVAVAMHQKPHWRLGPRGIALGSGLLIATTIVTLFVMYDYGSTICDDGRGSDDDRNGLALTAGVAITTIALQLAMMYARDHEAVGAPAGRSATGVGGGGLEKWLVRGLALQSTLRGNAAIADTGLGVPDTDGHEVPTTSIQLSTGVDPEIEVMTDDRSGLALQSTDNDNASATGGAPGTEDARDGASDHRVTLDKADIQAELDKFAGGEEDTGIREDGHGVPTVSIRLTTEVDPNDGNASATGGAPGTEDARDGASDHRVTLDKADIQPELDKFTGSHEELNTGTREDGHGVPTVSIRLTTEVDPNDGNASATGGVPGTEDARDGASGYPGLPNAIETDNGCTCAPMTTDYTNFNQQFLNSRAEVERHGFCDVLPGCPGAQGQSDTVPWDTVTRKDDRPTVPVATGTREGTNRTKPRFNPDQLIARYRDYNWFTDTNMTELFTGVPRTAVGEDQEETDPSTDGGRKVDRPSVPVDTVTPAGTNRTKTRVNPDGGRKVDRPSVPVDTVTPAGTNRTKTRVNPDGGRKVDRPSVPVDTVTPEGTNRTKTRVNPDGGRKVDRPSVPVDTVTPEGTNRTETRVNPDGGRKVDRPSVRVARKGTNRTEPRVNPDQLNVRYGDDENWSKEQEETAPNTDGGTGWWEPLMEVLSAVFHNLKALIANGIISFAQIQTWETLTNVGYYLGYFGTYIGTRYGTSRVIIQALKSRLPPRAQQRIENLYRGIISEYPMLERGIALSIIIVTTVDRYIVDKTLQLLNIEGNAVAEAAAELDAINAFEANLEISLATNNTRNYLNTVFEGTPTETELLLSKRLARLHLTDSNPEQKYVMALWIAVMKKMVQRGGQMLSDDRTGSIAIFDKYIEKLLKRMFIEDAEMEEATTIARGLFETRLAETAATADARANGGDGRVAGWIDTRDERAKVVKQLHNYDIDSRRYVSTDDKRFFEFIKYQGDSLNFQQKLIDKLQDEIQKIDDVVVDVSGYRYQRMNALIRSGFLPLNLLKDLKLEGKNRVGIIDAVFDKMVHRGYCSAKETSREGFRSKMKEDHWVWGPGEFQVGKDYTHDVAVHNIGTVMYNTCEQ